MPSLHTDESRQGGLDRQCKVPRPNMADTSTLHRDDVDAYKAAHRRESPGGQCSVTDHVICTRIEMQRRQVLLQVRESIFRSHHCTSVANIRGIERSAHWKKAKRSNEKWHKRKLQSLSVSCNFLLHHCVAAKFYFL